MHPAARNEEASPDFQKDFQTGSDPRPPVSIFVSLYLIHFNSDPAMERHIKFKIQFVLSPTSKDELEPSIIESTVFRFAPSLLISQTSFTYELESFHRSSPCHPKFRGFHYDRRVHCRLSGGTKAEIKEVEVGPRSLWQVCVIPEDSSSS